MTYLEPALPLLLVLSVVGLVAAWHRSTKGRRPWLLTISIAGILLLSMNAVAWVLSRPLEIWYADDPFPKESADAIVILAGTVHSPTPSRPYPLAGQDTYQRVQHGVWLFKHWKPLPILVCGGTYDENEPLSATMKQLLQSEGIAADLIWVENRSRSTQQNALYGSEILRKHGISRVALVVEANSMTRAAASFRKVGITVVPAPIRFTKLLREFSDLFPTWQAIELNGETLHEVLGLVWYRFRGWI